MTITTFLNSKGFNENEFEGYSQQNPPQVEDLINLTNKPNINVRYLPDRLIPKEYDKINLSF